MCSVPAGGWADRAVIAPGGQQGFLRPTSGRQVESIWVMDSKVLLESLPTPKIELLALLRAGVRVKARVRVRVRVRLPSSHPPRAVRQLLRAWSLPGAQVLCPEDSTHSSEAASAQENQDGSISVSSPPKAPKLPHTNPPHKPHGHPGPTLTPSPPEIPPILLEASLPLHAHPPPARGYPKGKPKKKKRETKANKRIPLTPQYTHTQKSRLVGRGSRRSTYPWGWRGPGSPHCSLPRPVMTIPARTGCSPPALQPAPPSFPPRPLRKTPRSSCPSPRSGSHRRRK